MNISIFNFSPTSDLEGLYILSYEQNDYSHVWRHCSSISNLLQLQWNDNLRAWIGIPLSMGIYDRMAGTLDAL